MKKIRVLIVDDSALVRELLSEILNAHPAIEVVGTASDPYIARDKIKKQNPDVLTLDVEMPRMDGISFLENLMRLRPMPVVMISSQTRKSADITLKALELGAVDFVCKPGSDISTTMINDYSDEITSKVKIAAQARVRGLDSKKLESSKLAKKLSADVILKKHDKSKPIKTRNKIIAIGASTGGTEAIRELVYALPENAPGIVIAQHIPAEFSTPFAERLNKACAHIVKEAEDEEPIFSGHVYISPGGRHLLIEQVGSGYQCRLNDGPAVNRHRPSVDVLFRAVGQSAGANAIGIILTGMGVDGAVGLSEMHDVGATTIAQDETSSVVWGMPGEAVKLGCVDKILSLSKISSEVTMLLQKADPNQDIATTIHPPNLHKGC